MKNIFKTIDIYSYKFSLLHNGHHTYKTKIGGFVSLLTFIMFIISFYYFAQNFILRLNPSVFLKQKIADESFISKIQDINMILGFSVDGVKPKEILDNTYFTTNVTITKKI